MIPKQVIKMAIKGGWLSPLKNEGKWSIIKTWRGTFMRPYQYDDLEISLADLALDPLFWQSLGKALEWDDVEDESTRTSYWHFNALKFFSLILTNGDTEKFWKDLITLTK